jgi:multiple sugar transport system substrate-binding protein
MNRFTKQILVLLCLLVLLFVVSIAASSAEKLVYWTFLTPGDPSPRSQVQDTLIEEFEKANPGVEVEVQVLPWFEINSRLIQSVAIGKGPDLSRVSSDFLEDQFAAGTLLPLDEFVAKEPASYKDDWVLPWDTGTYNGQKMALWIEYRAVMLYCRKDYLASIGAAVPKTWDELGTVGGQLTAKGYIGFATGLSFGANANGFAEWFVPNLWTAGGDLLDKDGKAAFNGPEGIKTMQYLYDLVYKYKAIPKEALAWDVDGLFEGFSSGRTAMVHFGTHRVEVARQKENIGNNLQVAPLPGLTEGKLGSTYAAGWNLAITKSTNNKELAWKLLKHMSSPEANILSAKVAGQQPVRKSAYQDPWFKEDPFGREMLGWVDYMTEYARPYLFPKGYLFLHRLLAEAAQRIVLNNEPIEEVLNEAALRFDNR